MLQWLTAQIWPTARQQGLFVPGQGSKDWVAQHTGEKKQFSISFAVWKTELLTVLRGWHQMFCSVILK